MTRLLVLLPLLWSVLASPAWATALGHSCVEKTTQVTHTGDTAYTDITDVAIAEGDLVDGKKYLVLFTAQQNEDGSNLASIRLVHGSTAFTESEQDSIVGTTDRHSFGYFTVWTAIAAEGIKVQHRTSNSAQTVATDQITLCAIKLSDDLVENTDWFFDEDAGDLGLTTTFQDGASVTLTPSAASDWLVLTWSQIDTVSTNPYGSRIDRSGEAASTSPTTRMEHSVTSENWGLMLMRVFALTAASNTFKEQSASFTLNDHTRLHSQVFALNLNKFNAHTFAYTEDPLSLGTTNYADAIATATLTPTVVSDALVCTMFIHDKIISGDAVEFRIQVDDTDDPGTQTSDNYQFDHSDIASLTNDAPLSLCALASSLSAAAHTLDVDGSAFSATEEAQMRTVFGFTMELAVATSGGQRSRDRVILE